MKHQKEGQNREKRTDVKAITKEELRRKQNLDEKKEKQRPGRNECGATGVKTQLGPLQKNPNPGQLKTVDEHFRIFTRKVNKEQMSRLNSDRAEPWADIS